MTLQAASLTVRAEAQPAPRPAISVYSCTLDETRPRSPHRKRRRRKKPLFDMGVRDAVISAPDFVRYAVETAPWLKKAVDNLALYCYYIHIRPSRGIRRTPMNVDEMAAKWEALLVGLATAHTKDEQDRWEHDIDELLTPILSAPVRQVREFFRRLVKRVKENERVPLYVWRSLEIWADQVVLAAPDQQVKELKTLLARQIADLVEEDVRRDIGEAVIGALMWRDPEQLAAIKRILEEGQGKPESERPKVKTETRAVGRQSCLFLVIRHQDGEETVML